MHFIIYYVRHYSNIKDYFIERDIVPHAFKTLQNKVTHYSTTFIFGNICLTFIRVMFKTDFAANHISQQSILINIK